MSTPIEIYLGKNGQTFGPYSIEQFAGLQAQADFASYTYIWDGRESQPDWKPIEKAPAPPAPRRTGPSAPPPDHQAAPQVSAPAPVRAPKPVLRGYDVPGLEALCLDARSVVTGKLTQVTDAGCELVCTQAAVNPVFGSQSPVTINLLDPKSGKSMNVAAKLAGVHRKDGSWSLKVIWDGCPELVLQQLSA